MDNTLATIMTFALTGAVINILVNYTKGFLTNPASRTLYVVGISFIGGLGVYFFHLIPVNIVETLLGVWASANTVYIAVTQYLNTSAPAIPAASV